MIDLDAVLTALDQSNGWLCLSAPTGTGKSTSLALLPRRYPDQVPELWLAQPTIANVHALAHRIGGDVGIGAAGQRTYSDKTPLKIMTAGHALNQLLRRGATASPLLVVVDEAHDRGVPTVGLVTALRHTSAAVRVVLASATADWSDAPAIHTVRTLSGWPCVEVLAPGETDGGYAASVQSCHALLDRALAEHARGVGGIVFLAGERCVRLFIRCARQRHRDVRFAPVYGGDAAARAVNGPPADVYVATDAAETGITLPRVRWVVDSGFHNRAIEDPDTGAVRLAPHRIDVSSATQRAGRANRCGPGTVYRASPPATLASPAPRSPGELLMLKLKLVHHKVPTAAVDALGPAPTAVALELIDEAGELTSAGRTAAGLPLRSPRAAAFLARLWGAASPAACAAACCFVAFAEADPGTRLFLADNRKRRCSEPEEEWRRDDDLEAATALLGAALEHYRQRSFAMWTEIHRVDGGAITAVLEHAQMLWAALGAAAPMPTPELHDLQPLRQMAAATLQVLGQPSLSTRGGGATYALGAEFYAIDRHRSLSRLPWLHRVAEAPAKVAAVHMFACRGRPPLLTGLVALAAPPPVALAPAVLSDDEY